MDRSQPHQPVTPPTWRLRLALGCSVAILLALGWFWVEQIRAVLETLALAYG
ncbi:MAG: hypothetical protein AAGI15_13890 [Pseudomonadota bacterium]